MPASNTEECFLEFVGKKVTGVIMGPELRPGAGTSETRVQGCLVFEDGRALCWYTSGAFYVEGKSEVDRAIKHRLAQLAATERELRRVADMAGLPSPKNGAHGKTKKEKKGAKASAKS